MEGQSPDHNGSLESLLPSLCTDDLLNLSSPETNNDLRTPLFDESPDKQEALGEIELARSTPHMSGSGPDSGSLHWRFKFKEQERQPPAIEAEKPV